MPVESFEVTSRAPFGDGEIGGITFERIDGIVTYAVDPEHPANEAVVDLQYATPDDDGLVRFSGDATLIVPSTIGQGNGGMLLDVPNRGHRVAPGMFHWALAPNDHEITLGRPLLFERAYAMAFCGWQWDVPRDDGRMGIAAPRIGEVEGEMQLRYQVSAAAPHIELTDQHVGEVGNHLPIAPDPQLMAHARLLVRQSAYSQPTELPRDSWAFATADDAGQPSPATTHVWLEGGFEAGLIYDLIYTPQECPVVGVGMVAMRDFASWLKQDRSFGHFTHVVGEGVSQCGRFLRTFLYHGMNLDESGAQAFDGLLIHVAGGRRGEFNHRYGQPSVQPTPGFGHLSPHADTGGGAGLLDRQALLGGVPKIFYTDTSAEYWRGDSSLTHIDPVTGADLELPANVRRFLLSSTQHGAGMAQLMDEAFSNRAANHFNVIDYRPLMRALVISLFNWVMGDIEPPASEVPRSEDGTAVPRPAVLDQLRSVSDLVLPDSAELNRIPELDLGPRASEGIGRFPAEVVGPPKSARVSALDADGNEVAGVAMPDVRLPVGTHTGFNPRHAETGAPGQLLQYMGSTRLFSPETLRDRYGDKDAYLAQIEAVAREAVQRRHLLEEDVPLCVRLAGIRFDMAMEHR